MNIIQLTPGAGAMYCGNCFRDNALVAALRQMGHEVTMIPLYLPLTLDEEDQSAGTPIFFGGISVYLEQKSGLFRKAPRWLRRVLASRKLLAWAAGRAASTRATNVGDILLSMLRGEEGRQARELEEFITWLKRQGKPDAICLSNALLVGMARRLKAELHTPVVCTLQGEDTFLDALPESHRAACWRTLAERASDVDLFIAPSRYFGDLMAKRLGLPTGKVRVVFNGINLEGFEIANRKSQIENPSAPVLGYFARMCRDKGLVTLVDAYILLKHRRNVPRLKLHVGGSCGPADEPFVKEMRKRLAEAGYIGEASFSPNLNRAEKIHFLRSLSVFSVPALYGEAFGLYVIEALAAGVPVVQPRSGAFPELIEVTGGGVLCEPGDPKALADAIEQLLLNSKQALALGEAGRKAVFEKFSAEKTMARETLRVLESLKNCHQSPATCRKDDKQGWDAVSQ
ncbi:MAG: glycosyltransferase family 4 protein [Verrucomicrobia bacterium]|nr:glycosyltransferase family 4 protein [Verrucomicrobiota bacterium]